MPTRRGWWMFQNTSTSATPSATTRIWRISTETRGVPRGAAGVRAKGVRSRVFAKGVLGF